MIINDILMHRGYSVYRRHNISALGDIMIFVGGLDI